MAVSNRKPLFSVREPAMPADPTIRAWRKQAHRMDGADAFLPDPESGMRIKIDDAESVAQEFIATATTGESVEMDAQDEVVDEEQGGPFIEIESEAELAETLSPDMAGLALSPALRKRRKRA
ncbi:MAG: hypothetical protein FWD69_10045 [Polyangiaceae bacterium]|nr:hypothetical protein [Polyangiaceae bacterium]